jgi:hypothetical protein
MRKTLTGSNTDTNANGNIALGDRSLDFVDSR